MSEANCSESPSVALIEIRGGKKSGTGSSRHWRAPIIAYAVVDADLYSEINKMAWSMSVEGYGKTAKREPFGHSMHRLVFWLRHGKIPKKEEDIDHLDRDKLNNRSSNLRIVSRSINKANCDTYKNNTSGFKGVIWENRISKWRARISKDGKRLQLGCFFKKEDAARAVNAAYRIYYPEVLVPNPGAEFESNMLEPPLVV